MGDRVKISASAVLAALVLGAAIALASNYVVLAIFFVLGSATFVAIRGRRSRMPKTRARRRGDSLRLASKNVFLVAVATSSLTATRLPGGFTLSDWLLAGSAGLLALSISRDREPAELSPTAPLLVGGVLLITFGGMISAVGSEHLALSLGVLIRVLATSVAFAVLAGVVLREERDLRVALGVWCGSVVLTSAGALIALATGWIAPGAVEFNGRYSGLSQHPNELGAMCAITLPVAIYLSSRRAAGPFARLLAVVAVALIGAGGLLSGSVTFIISSAIGLLVLTIFTGFQIRFVLPVVLVPAIVFAVASTLSLANVSTPFDRFDFSNPSGDTKGNTLEAREAANSEAITAIRAQPLVGTGFGEGLTTGHKEVHNLILQSWFEGGLFAALGILLILTTFGIRAYVAARAGPRGSDFREMNCALTGSFAAFLVFSMAALLIYKRFAWISPALVSAGYLVSIRRVSTRVPRIRRAVAGSGTIPNDPMAMVGD